MTKRVLTPTLGVMTSTVVGDAYATVAGGPPMVNRPGPAGGFVPWR
ncbi:MAG: hypothetical protein ACP5O0_11000 [Acidimicrobiales bacterium]